MKLKQKIAQKILVGFSGVTQDDEEVKLLGKLIREDNLKGVVLYNKNIENSKQLQELTSFFKKNRADVIIGVDQEGGLVQRLKPNKGFIGTISAKEIGSRYSAQEAFNSYLNMAKELFDHGINFNFAPVVDINNPQMPSPVIGALGRCYSSEPEIIANFAKSFVLAHRHFGIKTCLKHFPGHGSANEDTHKNLVDITNYWSDKELLPFEILIKNDLADAIMTAHLVHKNLDPSQKPATLSKIILGDILRKKLNYKGLIISDDLHMGAILERYPDSKMASKLAAKEALEAGCDLLVFSRNPTALNNGAIDDQSSNKAEKYNIQDPNFVSELIEFLSA